MKLSLKLDLEFSQPPKLVTVSIDNSQKSKREEIRSEQIERPVPQKLLSLEADPLYPEEEDNNGST